MNWIKKAYKDPQNIYLTLFLLIGFPLWSLLTYWVDGGNQSWVAAVFGWAFYFLVFLPLLYLHNKSR